VGNVDIIEAKHFGAVVSHGSVNVDLITP
jgi:hypothetical protein